MSRQARRVELTSRAERDLRRITPKDAARVVHALRQLALPEAPPNLDIKPLEGLSHPGCG